MGSGAEVHLGGGVAVKVGEPHHETGVAVARQGRWLEQHRSPKLPNVFAVWDFGYIMEELTPISLPAPRVVLQLLEDNVWHHEPEMVMNWGMHWRYVQELLCGEPSPWDKDAIAAIHALFTHVRRLDLTACLTHGDPTLENVMYRYSSGASGGYVLIDPIPARPAIGDLMAVDLGKVLQSVIGYETMLKGGTPHATAPGWTSVLNGYRDEDQEAARYFCCVHYARLMRYLDDEKTREVMKRRVGELLLGL